MKLKIPANFLLILLCFFSVLFSCPRHLIAAGNRVAGEREVRMKLIYKVFVDGHLNNMRLKMVIPDNIKNRQTVNDISFSIEPDSIYKINSNTYALFKFYDVDKSFKIVIDTKITIYRSIDEKNDSTEKNLQKYLVAEPNIESESPKIIAVAASLKQKTDIETAIKTFEYVKSTITYERNPPIGAEKVLETGVGKCMDYSDLFVALLRANNIPAKSMFGIVVDYSGDNPLHAWSEVYLKKQGWIRFDATTTHSEITSVGKNYLMKISNKYVFLAEGRNDPELHVHQYHYSYNCTHGTEIKVKLSFDIAA